MSYSPTINCLKLTLETFDINSVPQSVRRKSYVQYETLHEERKYFSPTTHSRGALYEAEHTLLEQHAASLKKVADELNYDAKVAFWQIHVFNRYGEPVLVAEYPLTQLALTVIAADLKNNEKYIVGKMKALGYYKVAENTRDDDSGMHWRYIMFNPVSQDSVNEYARRNYRYLYHFSPTFYDEEIMKKGFIPRNVNKVFHYRQPRVYFRFAPYDPNKAPTESDPDDFNRMMRELSKMISDERFNGEFYEYLLALSKIPKSVEFYRDPNSYGSVYSTQPVPYSAVVNKEIVQF